MEAIVLAGGLGTRLRSVVADVPKPMAPVHGRPFLAFVLDGLVAAHFAGAILAVGYRHDAIRSHFGETYRGLALRYSVEPEPLGTGGAIRLACEKAAERDIFVMNGDTYVEIDLPAMLGAHAEGRAQLTMAVCRVPDVARYGSLEVSDGIVRRFSEKGRIGPGSVNGGTYVLAPAFRERLPPQGPFSFEAFLARTVERIRPLAFPVSGPFVDIGVPEDYARVQEVMGRASA
jgi:NDP-sugar pyrophosphorylase family protein